MFFVNPIYLPNVSMFHKRKHLNTCIRPHTFSSENVFSKIVFYSSQTKLIPFLPTLWYHVHANSGLQHRTQVQRVY